MKRVSEPDLMNDPQQVAIYAGRHLDDAHWLFLQRFRKFFPNLKPAYAILDLGCGPAALAIRMVRQFPDCQIHGVDGAPCMLDYGREMVRRAGMEKQVHLFHGVLPQDLPLPRERYEAIISNSFLHHLVDPMFLWEAIRKYSLADAAILVIDLLRPDDESIAKEIVDTYMPGAPLQLQHDMLRSLYAAYTMEEVTAQLQTAELVDSLTLSMASPFQFAAYGFLRHDIK